MNWAFAAGSIRRSNGAVGAPCLSRRTALMTAFAFCLCVMAFPLIATASEQAAVKVVSQMMQDIGDLYRSATSEDQIADGLEEVFSNYSDMAVISRSVIGPPWRQISERQGRSFPRIQGYLSKATPVIFRGPEGAIFHQQGSGTQEGASLGRVKCLH